MLLTSFPTYMFTRYWRKAFVHNIERETEHKQSTNEEFTLTPCIGD